MKKLKILVILALLSISSVLGSIASIKTIGDAYTQESDPTGNYGGATSNIVYSIDDANMISYFLFDASNFTGDIPDVVFTSYIYTVTTGFADNNFSIFYCNDDFDQDTITWNNQDTEVTNCVPTPLFTTELTSFHYDGFINFDDLPMPDLDTYIENDTDKIFTLKIMFDPLDSADTPYLEIYTTDASYYPTISYNAPSVYEYDTAGFHIYEEFDTTHNASMWGEISADPSCWEVNTSERGRLIFNSPLCASSLFGGYILNNSNFLMEMQDEFDFTFVGRVSPLIHAYSGFQPNWQERTDTLMDNPPINQEFYSVFLRPAYTNVEYLSLADHIEDDATPSITNPSLSAWHEWKEWYLKKRNNENGTFYIEVYSDDEYLGNFSSEWDFAQPYYVTNWTQPLYFSWIGFEYAGIGLYDYQIDSFELNVTYAECTPDWSCSGYGACNISDLAPCNAVTDLNTCGDPYGGDYSEFSGQLCNYCSENLIKTNYSSCYPNDTMSFTWQDLNYSSCCDVTTLISDCSILYSPYNITGWENCTFNCTPDWSCTGFTACNISDEQTCNSVVDLNTCGLPYESDYTEFGDFACNYCSRDITLLNESACSATTDTKTACYLDNNFATCCNITGIGSDCIGGVPQSEDTVCVAESCSFFTYSENDITGAFINLIGKGFVTLSILAGLITVIGLGLWAYNRYKT